MLFRAEYSVVKRQGTYFLLNKNNWIDIRLLCFKSYEPENVKSMLEFLKIKNIRLFFDIGANFGFYSLLFSSNRLIDTVYAFEPLQRNYQQLCSNILINDLSDTIIPYRLALSDEKKSIDLWYNDRSTGTATLDNIPTTRSFEKKERITCATLDDIVQMTGERALVKIDVEGAELGVLQGMDQFLQNNDLILYIEIHENYQTIAAYLDKFGYCRLGAEANDYIFSNMT